MVYVALAEAVAILAIVAVFGNLLRIMVRQHARERDVLIDKLCHLAGKSWTEAPASATVEEAREPDVLVAAPEQYDDVWG